MIKALIVDDEPLAREALQKALSARDDIAGFDIAGDAVEALERLKRADYDVLLLDINMPEMSGLEMLDAIAARKKRLPATVFITAHDEHAIAAFERHAIDYVLKPFSTARIHAALDEAIHRTHAERAAALMGTMGQARSTAAPERLAIKAKGRVVFVNPSEIAYVEAEANYVLLRQENGSYLLREPISTVAEKLAPYGFVRIHRSVIVNSAYVSEVQPWYTGEYILKLRTGKEFTVTRTYKQNLGALAASWIGVKSF